jgi:hypothetical protein
MHTRPSHMRSELIGVSAPRVGLVPESIAQSPQTHPGAHIEVADVVGLLH